MENKNCSYLRTSDTYPIYERPKPDVRVILEDLEEDYEETSDNKKSSSQTSVSSHVSSVASENSLKTANVYLRIRPVEHDAPVWKFRVEDNSFVAANIENAQTKNKNTVEQHYKFSQVFDGFTSQMNIYNNCVKRLISLDDNASIMVYGTSGSGKTHTLLGDPYNPGLVPRALTQLFVEYGNNISCYPIYKLQNGIPSIRNDDQVLKEEMLKKELLNSLTDLEACNHMLERLKVENNFEARFIENCHLFVWVSFVEIYNEDVFDLLTSSSTDENKENNAQRNTNINRKKLKLISNNGQPFVQGALQIFVRSFEETIKILQYGMNRVSTGSTFINERSSRSHCIFFVDVIKCNNISMTSTSYKFCDLAGSERLKKTENIGKRLKEANNINKSLMTLRRCLAMANERQKNKTALIPYRDSKLTTLLQNALLGNETISLIINLNPKLDYIEENLNVLSFASIANGIITKPKERINYEVSRISRYSLFLSSMSQSQSATTKNYLQQQIDDLLDTNFELENEITRLQNNMVEQEINLRKSIVAAFEEDYQRTVKQFEKQVATRKMNYKAETDSLEIWLKQKEKLLQKKDRATERLRARLARLERSSDVIICDDSDSETDSDDIDDDTD